ncbi:hypothetical protein DSM107010_01890 [Chroococcidiopsis cubana SAG 39.79]|uniref:Uncharacterized protein n=1 Tax=Chroococcidiopsis cubana SAG 39.79 TaxID=388085 RepID=A0AB37UT65_9CYAN|nr:hypothetical protein DSM107010_01890 [Chroococcidiopsis cubana SAG 39.79]
MCYFTTALSATTASLGTGFTMLGMGAVLLALSRAEFAGFSTGKASFTIETGFS